MLSRVVPVILLAALLMVAQYGDRLRRRAVGLPTGGALLHLAACKGDPELFDQAVAEGASPNYADETGDTPLMSAALRGDDEMVARLLAMGADVDAQDVGGYTALLWAAHTGRASTIALLLRHGANPRHRSRSGLSAADIVRAMELPDEWTVLTELNGHHRRCH
jgi:uncharacterized protein